MENKEEIYKDLANRNGWEYSFYDGRPYFMKNGNYAEPNEETSEADKIILAEIVSEGSSEMAKLILMCWKNGIKISGPCSGIREFHDKAPISLHFCFIGESDLIGSLYEQLKTVFPSFDHLYRNINESDDRYDINFYLGDKELSKEESDFIFSIINNQLSMVIQNKNKQR